MEWAVIYLIGALICVVGVVAYSFFLAPSSQEFDPITDESIEMRELDLETHVATVHVEACIHNPIVQLTFSTWLNVETGETVAGAASASEITETGCVDGEGTLNIPRAVEEMGGQWRLAIFTFATELGGNESETSTAVTEVFEVG